MSTTLFLPGRTIDDNGSLNIGTLLSTGVNIGRVGFPVNIIGSINVSMIDGPGVVSVGTVLAASVSIGRVGVTTSHFGIQSFTAGLRTDLVQAQSATQMFLGLDAVGMALSPSSGTIAIDQFLVGGQINIGVANATGITLGRLGITTTHDGSHAFTGTLSTNSVQSQSASTLSIGSGATGLTLAPSSGVINIDQSTTGNTINVGGTNATSINIGRVGAVTTIVGTFNLSSIDVAGAVNVGTAMATSVTIGRPTITTTINGIADIANLDRAGVITIGGTSATSILIGRLGISTTINGTADIANLDRAGAILIGATNSTGVTLGRAATTTTVLGVADIAQIDRAGILTIGTTLATSLFVGRSGVTTTVNGTADIATLDRAGAIAIGNTNATSITVGRGGVTTTIAGFADIGTLDRSGVINIGTTLATGIFVGRSTIATTYSGTQAYINGINTDTIQARTAVAMLIGTNAAGLVLAPTNGIISVDQATTGAAINIGSTLATSLSLGRAAITTTILGTANLATIDRAGAISIGSTLATSLSLGRATVTTTILGTADVATMDRAGAIVIGGTNATSLTLGRAAIATTILGTADLATLDRAGAISIGGTSATSISIGRAGISTTHSGTQAFVNGINTDLVQARTPVTMVIGSNAAGLTLAPTNGVISMDQATTGAAINIGTSIATGIFIGRAAITTTHSGTQSFTNGINTDLIQARTAVPMVIGTNSAGLTLAPTNGTITIDQATTGGAMNMGTVRATSITIGRVGITTSINGPLSLNSTPLNTFIVDSLTQNASSAIPLTVGFMQQEMNRINNIITLTYRQLVAAVVSPGGGALVSLSISLGASFRPPADISTSALIEINGVPTLGIFFVLATGQMHFGKTTGLFAPGDSILVRTGSISFSFT